MKKILILCIGNICRSPMAMGLLNAITPPKKIMVNSAGINALVGHPAALLAQEVLQEKKGIDISSHRAKQVNPEILLAADLILVMDHHQKEQIQFDLPAICGRVLRIGQWRNIDIPDPYRRSKKIFEQTLVLLDECLKDWYTRL